MTGDLNTTFGHRFICNCSEAATTTLNLEPFSHYHSKEVIALCIVLDYPAA